MKAVAYQQILRFKNPQNIKWNTWKVITASCSSKSYTIVSTRALFVAITTAINKKLVTHFQSRRRITFNVRSEKKQFIEKNCGFSVCF